MGHNPMIPNADITIYNRVRGSSEVWLRRQVRRVVWQSTKAVNRSKPGMIAADSVFVMIPYARATTYLDPITWQASTRKEYYWTLQEGDVLVRGLVDDSPTTPSLVTTLRNKYGDVVTISSIDPCDEGTPNMQHFELSCK